jgi:diacylglycerol kinase family enzyme
MLAAMRATLIINPFASGVTEEGLAAVERELRPSFELTVALTKRPQHATELARGVDGPSGSTSSAATGSSTRC